MNSIRRKMALKRNKPIKTRYRMTTKNTKTPQRDAKGLTMRHQTTTKRQKLQQKAT